MTATEMDILFLFTVSCGSDTCVCVFFSWQRVGAVLHCEMNHGRAQEAGH